MRENMGRVIAKNVRRGFTIWELLTVIAIIALLIGLLLPALSRSRSYSTHIVCMSNLRQYGMAGLLFLEDNNNLFPGPSEWLYSKASINKDHPIGCRWHDRAMSPRGEIMKTSVEYRGKMGKYLEDVAGHPCPIFRDITRNRGCENPEHNNNLDIEPQNSYTMNGYLGGKGEGSVRNLSEVKKPSKIFFFGEENSWSVRPDHPKFPARWLKAPLSTKALDDTVLMITPTPEARDCFATYHGATSSDLSRGSGNAAFLDGHVERISVEDQLRKNMHGGSIRGTSIRGNPAGNLSMAWASESPPPGGWEAQ
jgi:prepilin-type N-terminal cleavage/methylation domain-containing protein/prepilin-type processing-associated H-X9-DG protein